MEFDSGTPVANLKFRKKKKFITFDAIFLHDINNDNIYLKMSTNII